MGDLLCRGTELASKGTKAMIADIMEVDTTVNTSQSGVAPANTQTVLGCNSLTTLHTSTGQP